jgi:hypothetical protein
MRKPLFVELLFLNISLNKGAFDEYKCTHYDDYYMDGDPWSAHLFFQKAPSKRTRKGRKNKMNESQQQKKPEKESFAALGFLLAIIVLGLLAGILKLIGLF